ncbi:LutC/YkgG family protein [Arhodomonas sp. SL1]|uniref:LutC/YkgG family protein n=1 Tax=Arhodomonas sp. SL1 TaxID=3425691 RepID=UPI003F88367F
MTGEADRMIETIRRALGRGSAPDPEAVERERRSMMAQPAPRPAWEANDRDRFLARLEAAAATWEPIGTPGALPGAVCRFLVERGVAPRIQVGADPRLAELDWPSEATVIEGLEGAGDAPAAVTVAVAGIAETGTLAFTSGPDNPASLNFLPEYHFVLLPAESIVAYMEDAWARVHAAGSLPRGVNLVTGPSRTGDVEQTIELGAHGPRSVHVLLLEP